MAKDATWITLHPTGTKYDDSDDIVFEAAYEQRPEIAWADDTHLNIDCRCRKEDVGFEVAKVKGVTISYGK